MSDILKIKSKIRDYEVHFVDDFASTLRQYRGANSFLIIDKYLLKSYDNLIRNLFPKDRIFGVEAIEQNKTIGYCYDLLKALIQNQIRRNSVLVVIGGGITQDISAFASSILYRGIEWVFYPTTLLAQADSCIGGKSSLNLDEYKNLLGSFYPPSRIFIDIDFLETLPVEAIKSGIGEMLHFYLIAGSGLAKNLMDNYEKIISSPKLLKGYIFSSLETKKGFIEIDEFDKNERNILNYGHTFGHAIETISGYSVNHGQAVTMGMDIANYVSLQFGYMNVSTFEAMHCILSKNMPDFTIHDGEIKDYLEALSKDKKNIGDGLTCILVHGHGSMRKAKIPLDERLKCMILDYFKTEIRASSKP
jgi:3-dehydroquinate synthase